MNLLFDQQTKTKLQIFKTQRELREGTCVTSFTDRKMQSEDLADFSVLFSMGSEILPGLVLRKIGKVGR